MNYSSKLIEEAVNEVSKLPGIGSKTALRLVLHMLKQPNEYTHNLAEALKNVRDNVSFCNSCHNISDSEICEICSSHKRDKTVVCVVEDTRDVMAIENTSQFTGTYHVLGGIISPMDGVGPQDLKIDSLVQKCQAGEIHELVFALPSTMEGDTTNFYISKRLQELNIKLSVIARGIAVGDELEYADEITLGRSIINRVPYENSLKQA